MAVPIRRYTAIWSEEWVSADDRLAQVERTLLDHGIAPVRGGDFDRWDLEVRGGLLGGVRVRHTVEEHGGGRQLVRFKVLPRVSHLAIVLPLLLLGPGLLAAIGGAWIASIPLVALGVTTIALTAREAGVAAAVSLSATTGQHEDADLASTLVDRARVTTEAPAELPVVAS